MQVRISIRNQTSSRRVPSASEFVKFLKTDESLHSFYVSECELYCLANILGLPLNLLTWSGQGAAGAKWDTYEPHQVKTIVDLMERIYYEQRHFIIDVFVSEPDPQ